MVQQKQFLNVVDLETATQLFHDALQLRPLGIEAIAVSDSLHRILALDVVSTINVPGFDRSNFDGFAVKAGDTVGASEVSQKKLRLLDERIPTAVEPRCEIEIGTAAQIATGAMLPRGADAVVLVEHTEVAGENTISISRPVVSGFGIAFAGTDIAQGQTVLRRGDVLTSRETGILAAIGCTEVTVFRKPRVAVISTGDEIIAPGQPMKPGMVYDSNARIISDAVRELGGEPVELGIAIDDLSELNRLTDQARQQADIVLLSGGTSKGDGDLSYKVVTALDDPGIVVHGVALKPGKPICLAVTDSKPVVVLPGFPTSAVFTFHEFVAPVIRKFAGVAAPSTSTIRARLATKVNSEIGRTEYLLATLTESESTGEVEGVEVEGVVDDGKLEQTNVPVAYPIGKGSGSVTTFGQADGFVAIDRYTEIVDEGSIVAVQLIGTGFRIADLTMIGSHCPGVDLLLSELQAAGFRTKLFAVGSNAGLQAAKRGDCDIAGIHLFDQKSGEYNRPFIDDSIDLIRGYQRMQSLVMRTESARDGMATPQELIDRFAGDNKMRMVNRNAGSGTRILIDRLLGGKQPPGYAMQPTNHHAVSAAIIQQRADWGVAIESAAQDDRLNTFAICQEHFDFAVPRRRRDRPAVIAFEALLRDPEIQSRLKSIGCRVVS